MSWKDILKSFTPLEELEEWMQVFINSIYEMQGDLGKISRHWYYITDIIQMIAYKGKGADHKHIMKLFGRIVEYIEEEYSNGKELKDKLQTIITRRKEERYV